MKTTNVIDIDNPICVALDAADATEARNLARAIGPHVGMLKVGLTSFIANGGALVAELAESTPVFLDLKLHDIPAQVQGAMRAIAGSGASYTTVPAAGGTDMLEAALDAAGEVVVLGVTILTSLDDHALHTMGFEGSTESNVLRLAEVALGVGLTGLVCSPREVAAVRQRFGPRSSGGPLLVVPGIRTGGDENDDQKRTLPARAAIEAGADVIVVGRPITAAPDPVSAVRTMLMELR